MMFELVMMDNENREVSFFYDPINSTITDKDGKNVIEDIQQKNFNNAFPLSPNNPAHKDAQNISTLKIQLGLQCNYTCSYCLQRNQIDGAAKTSTHDAKMFLFHLDKWLKSAPKRIEFWGGEPLLYWNKIVILHQELRKKFPEAEYLIITNGSLLDDEKLEYIGNPENKIGLGISHDGPGQHIRGPDPLLDKKTFEMLYKAVHSGIKMSFNAVLTPASYNPAAVVKFFKDRFGPNVVVGFEGVVVNYDDDHNNLFTQEQYLELAQNVARTCITNYEDIPVAFRSIMQSFVNTLKYQKPASALSQKCGMDLPSNIAVDLTGNVLTCQNVGVEDHKIGHVFDMNGVKLNTAWHWSHRKECSTCPLLQMCAGSCMFNSGKSFYYSCNNKYYFYLGLLAGALYHMSGGLLLKEIRGEIIRPDPVEYGIETPL